MSNDDISLIPMNTPLVQEGEEDPNEPNGFTTRTYRRRFYVVFVVSLIAFAQSWIWNGWGPIQRPVEQVFGWTDSTIALLANWGPIAYVLSVVFWTWLMGKMFWRQYKSLVYKFRIYLCDFCFCSCCFSL
eukprot:m.197616 g.197616  ORF g.197616 m.197616 type:complete len:130 (+) comp39548_c0_seq12:72-461(+)